MPRAPAITDAGSAPAKWRSIPTDGYLIAGWNNEYAVYHRLSGKTHFLNEAGRVLLTEILTHPCTIESAAHELSGYDAGEECEPEYVRNVANTIARLRQIGLVDLA